MGGMGGMGGMEEFEDSDDEGNTFEDLSRLCLVTASLK
jgi:hypothetical protein